MNGHKTETLIVEPREYQKEIKRVFNKEDPELDIYFSPCDTYAKEGGCFNCITNFIYEIL